MADAVDGLSDRRRRRSGQPAPIDGATRKTTFIARSRDVSNGRYARLHMPPSLTERTFASRTVVMELTVRPLGRRTPNNRTEQLFSRPATLAGQPPRSRPPLEILLSATTIRLNA